MVLKHSTHFAVVIIIDSNKGRLAWPTSPGNRQTCIGRASSPQTTLRRLEPQLLVAHLLPQSLLPNIYEEFLAHLLQVIPGAFELNVPSSYVLP